MLTAGDRYIRDNTSGGLHCNVLIKTLITPKRERIGMEMGRKCMGGRSKVQHQVGGMVEVG